MAGAASPAAPGYVDEPPDVEHRRLAHRAWVDQSYGEVLTEWKAQPAAPTTPTELLIMADSHAVEGNDAEAKPLLVALAELIPIEAKLIEARMHWAGRRYRQCWAALMEAFIGHRSDPWVDGKLLNRAMALVVPVAQIEEDLIPEMREVLAQNFAVSSMRYLREDILIELAVLAGDHEGCARAHDPFEPWVPWNDHFLQRRVDCYERAGDPRLVRARAELRTYRADAGSSFRAGVPVEKPSDARTAP